MGSKETVKTHCKSPPALQLPGPNQTKSFPKLPTLYKWYCSVKLICSNLQILLTASLFIRLASSTLDCDNDVLVPWFACFSLSPTLRKIEWLLCICYIDNTYVYTLKCSSLNKMPKDNETSSSVPFGGPWPPKNQSRLFITIIFGASSHRLFVSLKLWLPLHKESFSDQISHKWSHLLQNDIKPMSEHRLFDHATRTQSRPN